MNRGEKRNIYFAFRTRRATREVNFSSSCSADYQHRTYLSLCLSLSRSLCVSRSLPMHCPRVNYYLQWTEHETNLILLFRVCSSFPSSLIFIHNDLDYRTHTCSRRSVNVGQYISLIERIRRPSSSTLPVQMPLVRRMSSANSSSRLNTIISPLVFPRLNSIWDERRGFVFVMDREKNSWIAREMEEEGHYSILLVAKCNRYLIMSSSLNV